jgi:hypothetical protein
VEAFRPASGTLSIARLFDGVANGGLCRRSVKREDQIMGDYDKGQDTGGKPGQDDGGKPDFDKQQQQQQDGGKPGQDEDQGGDVGGKPEQQQ